MNDAPKRSSLRRRWPLIAACLGALVFVAVCLRSSSDRRFVGRWTFTPNGASAPTVQFTIFEDGTGTSESAWNPTPSRFRWCTAGDWLFFDDPAPDGLTRLGQSLGRAVVQISGRDFGPVDCLRIVTVGEMEIQVRHTTGKATLRRIAD